ncbi:alpha/beta fold hydrolase [Xanthobacter sp. 126]|uniref:alpha/beta fold hydrolase n=1 Tax=Xanthobacter sp. 126 TaxID=1131814 RepID=UPI0004A5D30B|nr:alpha/beta fold hydrolase [Xanthobacter sp. 126]
MPHDNPEIGASVRTGAFATNVHDRGHGTPVLLIHGSGPGVSAWANWRGVIPALSERFRVVAPDMVGFGFSDRPSDIRWTREIWVRQVLDLMDALGLERVDIVGNSFGGAIGLALAVAHPVRVRRLVLMGSVGLSFPISEGLEKVWGYEPSLSAMRELLDIFAFDRGLVTDELAELRFRASTRPGFQESFSAMFPAPRQRHLDALASYEAEIRALPHEVLIVHGREDRVIPLDVSLRLTDLIDRAQLHVFGRCGHWTQIEHAVRFNRLVGDFLAEEA